MIALPKLNGLNPTLESTALKLMEETGELAQAIGKYRGFPAKPPSTAMPRCVRRLPQSSWMWPKQLFQ